MRTVSLLLPLVVSACAVSPDAAPITQEAGREAGGFYDVGQGIWGERVVLDVQFLPAYWVDVDDDDGVLAGQSTDSSFGLGVATRLGRFGTS